MFKLTLKNIIYFTIYTLLLFLVAGFFYGCAEPQVSHRFEFSDNNVELVGWGWSTSEPEGGDEIIPSPADEIDDLVRELEGEPGGGLWYE